MSLMEVVQFDDGNFGVRKKIRGVDSYEYQYLDIADATNEDKGKRFVNWKGKDEPSFWVGGKDFDWCQTDSKEGAFQAYDYVIENGDVASDYGTPVER